jgi:hypothetical protein
MVGHAHIVQVVRTLQGRQAAHGHQGHGRAALASWPAGAWAGALLCNTGHSHTLSLIIMRSAGTKKAGDVGFWGEWHCGVAREVWGAGGD